MTSNTNLYIIGILALFYLGKVSGQNVTAESFVHDSLWTTAKSDFLHSNPNIESCSSNERAAILGNSIAYSKNEESLFDFLSSNVPEFDTSEHYIFEIHSKENRVFFLVNSVDLNREFLLGVENHMWKMFDNSEVEFDKGKKKFQAIKQLSCDGEKTIGIHEGMVLFLKTEENIEMYMDCDICTSKVNLLMDKFK